MGRCPKNSGPFYLPPTYGIEAAAVVHRAEQLTHPVWLVRGEAGRLSRHPACVRKFFGAGFTNQRSVPHTLNCRPRTSVKP